MKKINSILAGLFLTASIFFTQQANAQAPQSMSYQSVLRNSSNALVSNTAVGIKISVLQGSASGSEIFSETQAATTNANGLLSLQIGAGNAVTGAFANIDWANGPYFIKTETDPTGGSNYTIVGTQQLASVPYALYAAKSGDATTMGAISDSPSANGGTITNGALSLAPADATNGGVVTTGDQTFAGAKTFSNDAKINGVTVGAGGLGSSWYDLAVGYSALLNNTTGYGNTALGASTLSLNTGGSDNTAVGNGALQQNTSGYRNTVIGASAQRDNTNGYYNTATGFNALMLNISGSNNTANGSYALLTNTTGSNNSAFGNEADVATGDLSNATAIGAGAIVDASNKIQLGNSAITSVNTSGTYTGAGFKTPNGTSSQYLMADGSVSTGAAGPQGATGLPSGTTGQTLRYNGTDWVANSTLYNDGSTIGVGTSTPNSETSLDIATQLPVLFPSMTQTQINNIAAPVEGMVQFNTDAHKLQVYAMLTNNASILNEIYLGTEANSFSISQYGISPIDGQIIAVELLLKDQFSSPYPAINMGGQGSFTVPSFGSFTWFTFVLPNPIAVTAGNNWSINFSGPGVIGRKFATNSNYPNGSGCCYPGADDLLFRVHIQPNPGSYGWQNMH